MKDLLDYDPKNYIIIKGAKLHNLKSVDLVIPKNKLVVFTGLSGSGKSTLAFETIYAEGQRRYIESLSSYARQFMGRLNKPKVEYIKGLSPSIAVEQKVNNSNPRSTVGTRTEIYDYLKLLFARIGKTYSPISNNEVRSDNTVTVLNYVKNISENNKHLLLSPIEVSENRPLEEQLKTFKQQGFSRLYFNNQVFDIDDFTSTNSRKFDLIIDRLIVKHSKEFYNRLSDSIELAFHEGAGRCSLLSINDDLRVDFSNKFELDGISFLKPNIHLFSFNNPYGACSKCEGFGDIMGVDPELVIPDTSLSIYEGAIAPWRGTGMMKFQNSLVDKAYLFNFPIHKPYFKLSEENKKILWSGNFHFTGITPFFKKIKIKNYKIQNRVLLSRYRGKSKCTECDGSRIRIEASYVKVNDRNMTELLNLSIDEVYTYLNSITLNKNDKKIAERILKEITSRLSFMIDVGLGYLTLNRKSSSLSGGESQRIQIATSLGSSLVGSIYVLDEPSIGLHSRDTEKLITVLKNLKNIGNTVLVVEHDESIIRAADYIIDIGPGAGSFGGKVINQGTLKQFINGTGLTQKYITGELTVKASKKNRLSNKKITIKGARENNLKNIDVNIPLECLIVVSGVSGSGKTTLVKKILYPALLRAFNIYTNKPGEFSSLDGDVESLKSVEYIDQNPIGRSSRSNPVTYVKAYDDIRNLFSIQELSKQRGYKPKHFSFNVDGGRCDSCKGEGVITIEMQFMADVVIDCENCNGSRFKKEICEIEYNNLSINNLLKMTIDEALSFFELHSQNKIVNKLNSLKDVGLGYVTLGQSSSTLSGGEAQRIKLASYISQGFSNKKVLFIFDEPTSGLHFHDVNKLMDSFNLLIEKGHTIVVVEHNLDIIKYADHLIDLGPEAGEKGGYLVGEGKPSDLMKNKKSITGNSLVEKLK
jgi:excinuclease ABC subunit A